MSTFEVEHRRLLNDLKVALNKDLARLSIAANGGRSILFVYPPQEDERYIIEAKKLFPNAIFIDLHKLFVEFIDGYGIDCLKECYSSFGKEIYISNNFNNTFHNLIIKKISQVIYSEKIPIIIHTGTIYNMGFSIINMMEQEIVMKSLYPLVFFYPAIIDRSRILFLGKQSEPYYRCIVIK